MKLQANAVEGIDSCKERTKCGGAKDKEEAQRQLAVKMMILVVVIVMVVLMVVMVLVTLKVSLHLILKSLLNLVNGRPQHLIVMIMIMIMIII